jgi:Family of unknown function (DUF6526)
MAEQTQTYKNHGRWYPLVHFVIFPLLLVNLGWQIYMLTQERTIDRSEMLLLAILLVLISFAARLQPLKVQDRIIRLEERLRYYKLLPHDVAEKAARLSPREMISLRFAPDDELPELVERVLNGELSGGKEIKLAIQNWRADHLRA